jgi:hypothetical protein
MSPKIFLFMVIILFNIYTILNLIICYFSKRVNITNTRMYQFCLMLLLVYLTLLFVIWNWFVYF